MITATFPGTPGHKMFECENAENDGILHCVGNFNLYFYANERSWRMHACRHEPMWMSLPRCWSILG